MFLGVFAAESVLELSAFMSDQSREKLFQTIRVHYWIDILVELPVVFVVIASGIAMIFLADKLTTLHFIKIGCVAAMFISALPCKNLKIELYEMDSVSMLGRLKGWVKAGTPV